MGNTLRWTVFMGRTFALNSATGHHLQMGESLLIDAPDIQISTVTASCVDRPRVVGARFGDQPQLENLEP
jgi:hypothetical protein